MKFKKILSLILSFILFFSFCPYKKVKAVGPGTIAVVGAVVTIGGMAVNAVKILVDGGGTLVRAVSNGYNMPRYNAETERYKGFRPMLESTRMITDIVNGTSTIKIYGQEIAKRQCLEALAGCIGNIYSEINSERLSTDKRGNIVYMIGRSGVGKTTMARAIADALLKYSLYTCIFIDSSQINREQPLGEQLFKITNKIANLRRIKTLFGALFGEKRDEESGTYDAKVASPLLDHLSRWCESVVIIDEFEKMKSICTPAEAPPDYEDRSADEIIKSIAANGYYMVGTQKIDCSKTLFMITTNETREQLYENFGHGGAKGGGVQRLNIIEFENLSKDCCRRIVNDMIKFIRDRLTDPTGEFKIKRVEFSEETLDRMADYILNDKLKQARAKIDLEQNILSLFIYELKTHMNKSFIVNYVPSLQEGEIGAFSISEVEAETSVAPAERTLSDQAVLDFSEHNTEIDLRERAPQLQVLKDYSAK